MFFMESGDNGYLFGFLRGFFWKLTFSKECSKSLKIIVGQKHMFGYLCCMSPINEFENWI